MGSAFYIVLKKYIPIRYMVSKTQSIGFLLLIICVSVLFSLLFPLSTNIHEGLSFMEGFSLSNIDVTNVQTALNTYKTSIEDDTGSCDMAVKAIRAITLPPGTTDYKITNSIPLVLANNQSTHCAKVDAVNDLQPTNTGITNAIEKCYGDKYTAVLQLLSTIQNSSPTNESITDDSTFAEIITKNKKSPVIKGSITTVSIIKNYITSATSPTPKPT
jgi:hypothetical protein